MALTTTPEALHEIGQLHARIAELERLSGIRAPGTGPAELGAKPPEYAAGLHEIMASFVDEMVVVCNIAGEILHANHATERVLGYRPHEMVGTNAWSYVHPEDLKATAAARSAPLDDGIPFENRARAADGSYRWLEFVARRWPQQDPTHIVLRFRRAWHREGAGAQPAPADDAPAKLHTQLRYAASLARLSQLALGLPLVADVLDAGTSMGSSGLGLTHGAWLVPDEEGLRVAAETGLGPSARGLQVPLEGSLAGLAWTRQAAADDAALPRQARSTDPLLLAAGAACALAVPVRGADRLHGVLVLLGKEPRTFEPSDTHFAETVANVLATSLDSRAAQEALGRRERLTRAVFDHARDGLAIVDDDGRVVDANQAAHAALGVASGALRGALPAEVAATDLDLSVAASTRGAARMATVRTESGKRALEVERVQGILPSLSLVILRDVTERRELQERLGHADRLVALGTLAAGVAQELHAPLATVSANLQYLADLLPQLAQPGDERPGKAVQAVQESSDATARLRGIIDGLRAFVRDSSAGSSPADVSAMIHAALAGRPHP
jgi:PAS domain S-box-containing protein